MWEGTIGYAASGCDGMSMTRAEQAPLGKPLLLSVCGLEEGISWPGSLITAMHSWAAGLLPPPSTLDP